jgi:hypothetical protein
LAHALLQMGIMTGIIGPAADSRIVSSTGANIGSSLGSRAGWIVGVILLAMELVATALWLPARASAEAAPAAPMSAAAHPVR